MPSGNCIVAHERNPNVKVIAVQSEAAPAMWHAWRNRNLEPYPTMKTEHEGLATRVPFELTNRILWELLSEFVLVSDEEINNAIRILARDANNSPKARAPRHLPRRSSCAIGCGERRSSVS